MKNIFIIFTLINILHGDRGFGPTDQKWGHVTVRKGTHIFWWFHKTLIPSSDRAKYTDRPLVIWLQGGPGVSGTAYGNFVEIGPLDPDLKTRNATWLKDVNLLFVDYPAGTGFSCVDSGGYATTNREIARDFLAFLRGFYEAMPEVRDAPLYIFAESYGGKMTAQIALVIHQAVKNREINVSLKGIGLGSPWISPVDAVLSWAPYLLNLGIIDQGGFSEISKAAEDTAKAVVDGKFGFATKLWGITERTVLHVTHNVNFYNVLSKTSTNSIKYLESDLKLYKLMNEKVKGGLKLNGTFRSRSSAVFNASKEDFMKPVTEIVEWLLNTTDIEVAVFNGQLDLMVNTLGTMAWLDKLRFRQSTEWTNAKRSPIIVDRMVEGYYKKAGRLTMYWVNRAGHMVPVDNPSAMRFILKDIINN